MADNIVGGLFGVNPELLMQQRQEIDARNAYRYANLDPLEQAKMSIYQGGAGLARGVSGLLGGDPELEKVSKIQQLSSQFNFNTPQGVRDFARAIQPFAPNEAMMAAKRADEMDVSRAAVSQKMGENINTMIGSGKYTPESLGIYQRTRNAADLVLADKGLTGANKEKVAAAIEANTLIESGTAEIGNYRDMIKKGEVQYGPITNLGARASAAIGSPTENAIKQQEIESFLTGQINEVLNAAKGVQAKDDALRAERQIKGYLAQNSSAGMDKALELLEKTKLRVKQGNEAYISSLTGETPSKQSKTPTGGNTAIYNTVRNKAGWEDSTDAEIDAAIKSGKIKTGKSKGN
jgi:hypothetical protein